VYEYLTFDGREHHLFANFNNNYEKTISIFSGGKLFSATGWKVGWAIAPPALLRLSGIIANTVYYCFSSPFQVAFGKCLDILQKPGYQGELSYQQVVRQEFQQSRDALIEELA
jgi:aspartate/methionine/tyrosine aminotransferase